MKIAKALLWTLFIIGSTNQMNANCCNATLEDGTPDNCTSQWQMQLCVNANKTNSLTGYVFNGQLDSTGTVCATCGHLPSDHYCNASKTAYTPPSATKAGTWPRVAGTPPSC